MLFSVECKATNPLCSNEGQDASKEEMQTKQSKNKANFLPIHHMWNVKLQLIRWYAALTKLTWWKYYFLTSLLGWLGRHFDSAVVYATWPLFLFLYLICMTAHLKQITLDGKQS